MAPKIKGDEIMGSEDRSSPNDKDLTMSGVPKYDHEEDEAEDQKGSVKALILVMLKELREMGGKVDSFEENLSSTQHNVAHLGNQLENAESEQKKYRSEVRAETTQTKAVLRVVQAAQEKFREQTNRGPRSI